MPTNHCQDNQTGRQQCTQRKIRLLGGETELKVKREKFSCCFTFGWFTTLNLFRFGCRQGFPPSTWIVAFFTVQQQAADRHAAANRQQHHHQSAPKPHFVDSDVALGAATTLPPCHPTVQSVPATNEVVAAK